MEVIVTVHQENDGARYLNRGAEASETKYKLQALKRCYPELYEAAIERIQLEVLRGEEK